MKNTEEALLLAPRGELRSAIDQLKCDRKLRDRLGQQGRVAYDAEFGERLFLEHYLAAVRRLLKTKRTRGTVEVNESASGLPHFVGRAVLLGNNT